MRRGTRIRRAVLAMAVLLIGGLAFPSTVKARDMGQLEIREGEIVEKHYEIIPGNNPAGEAVDPPTCMTSVYCDVIHLHVDPPKQKGLGFFVQVKMTWDVDLQQGGVPQLNEVTSNDMDLYIFRYPYDSTKKSDEQTEDTGATTEDPEVAYTTQEDAYLVISNYLGVNKNGYTLKLTYVTDEAFQPFESLEQDFQPADLSAPPPDTSDLAPVPAPPAAPAGPVRVSPTLSAVGVDDPFGLSGSAKPKANTKVEELLRPATKAASNRPPGPVSLFTVLLWLAVVPGAVFGGAAAWLLRRRRAFTLH